MVMLNKPKSITVTVVDRKSNESRSLTVYGEVDEVFTKVKKAFKEKKPNKH